MKKILLLFILAILASCSDNNDEVIVNSEIEIQNACTAQEPLDLEWIKQLITELKCGEYSCKVSILKSKYEGEIVYYTEVTDGLCNSQVQYKFYNCNGKIVKELNNEESVVYYNLSGREVEEIFSCNG